ncbi:Mitochondrial substrate carrier family protein Q [Hondaea fermentalgiana]|uniref:Mitochondrial substrate carrier family protein Q n=1 Tax=Hondaea fermentalgiana TaxID=2315210 RepID=A0A2R5G758_9STRA|nr:Mitochondrial substrate carrier family protein Q [Hondaea fermentalgiana]|eukprot:GBG26365.1 Mitochondrial substrate carrier family protein Q [Hondaea fermentalgiana]
MESLGEACAGGAAGVFATASMYPLVVVKTRLQAQRKQEQKGAAAEKTVAGGNKEHYDGPLDCLRKIAAHEGLAGFLSGMASSLPRAFLTNFIFYFFYAYLKPFFQKLRNHVAGNMAHGILAGIGVQLVMVPYEMVNVKVITDKTGKATFLDTFARLLRTEGPLGFYKGIVPAIILTLNPGITNVVRHYVTPSGAKASASKNFWSGALSKAVASLTTYPYVVAKVQMFTHEKKNKKHDDKEVQVGKGGNVSGEDKGQDDEEHHEEKLTTAGVLGRIIREEGLAGIYKGCEMQVGTAILKEAILNMTRHQIERFIMSLFVAQAAQ